MRSLLVSLKETVALYAFNYFINRFQKPGLHFFDVFIIAQKSNFVQTLFQKPVFQSGNLFSKLLCRPLIYKQLLLFNLLNRPRGPGFIIDEGQPAASFIAPID